LFSTTRLQTFSFLFSFFPHLYYLVLHDWPAERDFFSLPAMYLCCCALLDTLYVIQNMFCTTRHVCRSERVLHYSTHHVSFGTCSALLDTCVVRNVFCATRHMGHRGYGLHY
jgi:hypothetical protein